MIKILLVHWNAGEAEERLSGLRSAGYEASLLKLAPGSASVRTFAENPPAAFVIDLSRLPSHGREVASAVRRQKGTRSVPIVFVGGEPEKVAAVRKLLPDAGYADWPRIRTALQQAIRNPPKNPAVPGVLAGYSGTPLPKKLGIRPGWTVSLLGAPADFETTLGSLPENVRLDKDTRGHPNLILLFGKSRADLERRFPSAARAVADGGGLWMIWPKKASGVPTDLSENEVRTLGLSSGFVDYKVCAVDQTWSGLLFARRRRSSTEPRP